MKRTLVTAVFLLFLLGCGSNNPGSPESVTLREATEAPPDFSTTFDDLAVSDDCRSSLRDPVDDAELILIRFQDGTGDYKVPLGKYGLAADELLRINCRTGEVLGIVKK